MREIVLAATATSSVAPFMELFLSSFLGVGTALLVEAIWDRYKDKELKEQLTKNFEAELTHVIEIANGLANEKVYMSPFSIPVWRGATSCGSILSLDNENAFFELLDVFSSIDEANQIETRCFELLVGNSNSQMRETVLDVLKDNRQHVIEQATRGISLIQRGRNK